MKLVSIVIPCYNSSKTIKNVVNDIMQKFDSIPNYDVQIILVDDFSPDQTYLTIKKICDNNKYVQGLRLSRNYGQAAARMAGMNYVKGDIILCMDDDGQHPVEQIPNMIQEIENGADIVYAHFIKKETTLFKKITSRITRKIYELLQIIPPNIYVSSYFAINGKYRDQIQQYKSPYPSIGTYLYQYTSKFKNIEMVQKERIAGKSGYHLNKLVNLFLNTITNFSIIPVRFMLWVGITSIMLSLLWFIVLLIAALLKINIANGFSIMAGIIALFCSILLLAVSIVGEYIVRMYILISGKPQFSIDFTIEAENK